MMFVDSFQKNHKEGQSWNSYVGLDSAVQFPSSIDKAIAAPFVILSGLTSDFISKISLAIGYTADVFSQRDGLIDLILIKIGLRDPVKPILPFNTSALHGPKLKKVLPILGLATAAACAVYYCSQSQLISQVAQLAFKAGSSKIAESAPILSTELTGIPLFAALIFYWKDLISSEISKCDDDDNLALCNNDGTDFNVIAPRTISPKEHNYKVIKQFNGASGAKLLDNGDEKLVWKPTKNDHTADMRVCSEVGGSQATNFITNGFVPEAYPMTFNGQKGTATSFLELTNGKFDIKENPDKKFAVDKFTTKEKTQLFIHMIADYAISNWDNHNEQFAFDGFGNIISYDKGQAFKLMKIDETDGKLLKDIYGFCEEEGATLDRFTWEPFNAQFSVYTQFARRIRKGDVELDKVAISEAFTRCESITSDQIQTWFGGYAVGRYPGDENRQRKFLKHVSLRIRKIRTTFNGFFNENY